jgi:hypothetical protein
MSKRKSTTPMTKGRALIEARTLLGPKAGVQRTNGQCFVFVNQEEGDILAVASTYEAALTKAHDAKLAD